MHLAGQDPHEQAIQVRRRADRGAPRLGHVAQAVLEVAENAVVGLRLDSRGQHAPQFAVHGGTGALVVPEQEGQVHEAELGDAIGQIAAGLVPESQDALLHQPEDIQSPVAQVEDVVDVTDFHLVPEAGLKPVAHALQRQAEAGGGRPVAGHDDSDGPIAGPAPLSPG